jgi:hypothetical protein
MASKGIPVVKAKLGGFESLSGFGEISVAEQERRHRLTVAVENLEENRESLGQAQVQSQGLALKAELEAGSRWDDYRSDTGAFLKNLWYDRPEKYYYKYTDLTARLRELLNWARGGSFDEGTAAASRPYSAVYETVREAPAPVGDRIAQIAKEDVLPAAKKLGKKLEEDDLFRKRFLVVLGVLVGIIFLKKLLR